MLGCLCTSSVAFLPKWHGVFGGLSFDITICCFLHLEGLCKQSFGPALPHAISLFAPTPASPASKSPAPEAGEGQAVFQVNKWGSCSRETQRGTALQAGSPAERTLTLATSHSSVHWTWDLPSSTLRQETEGVLGGGQE